MSEFHVNVIRLGSFTKHPNADSLDITKVFDYTVIVKHGKFKEGDLAVYVPIDSVVPDNEEWHWLAPRNNDGSERFPVGQVPERYRVIEAKKIRGIFSQGCLMPLPHGGDPRGWTAGMDVATTFGITKYEPPVPMAIGGECEPAPKGWAFPTYTDIEGMRRYPHVIQDGEDVVMTEKLHGANARYCHDGERLWVGSHNQIKRREPNVLWWTVALAEGFEEKFSKAPMHVFFGEVYGQVQDLKYGVKAGAKFRCFDVYDVKAKRYLDFEHAFQLAEKVGVPWVPILYTGPWKPELIELCEGKSTLADNVREGFVVRPTVERWHEDVGRVVLKRHGEGYLLRKKNVDQRERPRSGSGHH